MNLATHYLGLPLRNPFIVGASPLCDDATLARRLQDAGASAVVMRSLFEEQIDSPLGAEKFAVSASREACAPFPEFADYQFSPARYLRQLAQLKSDLTIPVIASLNGRHPGRWVDFAAELENTGADAIELNFYQLVTSPSIAVDQVETEMLATVGALSALVRIPIAVKLSPFHASIAQLAVALELAGAAGVVLFNRFYEPDVDLDAIEMRPRLHLSDASELLWRLRWLAILSPQLRRSLAASGGVHGWDGAAKALLMGAHAVQLVSALLRHGPDFLPRLIAGLESWMRAHGFTGLEQFRGRLGLQYGRNPAAFERANDIRALQSWPQGEAGITRDKIPPARAKKKQGARDRAALMSGRRAASTANLEPHRGEREVHVANEREHRTDE